MSAEIRTAYRVDVNYSGEQVLEEYQCVITPKRVAVSRKMAGGGYGHTVHCDPQHWPERGHAWTIPEAWARFIEEKQQELASARESVRWLEQHVADASATFAALRVFPPTVEPQS